MYYMSTASNITRNLNYPSVGQLVGPYSLLSRGSWVQHASKFFETMCEITFNIYHDLIW